MPTFKPVVFKTTSGYEFTVTCLHDVFKVLAMGWPNKCCERYTEAVQLAEKAKQGWCTPKSAYEAFVDAAHAQKRIVEPRPMLDRVIIELSALDPENFNPHPTAPMMPFRGRRAAHAGARGPRKQYV
ncbi:DUF982 domain-containing protein [Mesorhizobium sp. UC22_110]|uniref:DUF982 domain-containing protein n=1 Tax=unclassified Mesorhizobium TaxID=325217 RepID=UPI003670CDCF